MTQLQQAQRHPPIKVKIVHILMFMMVPLVMFPAVFLITKDQEWQLTWLPAVATIGEPNIDGKLVTSYQATFLTRDGKLTIIQIRLTALRKGQQVSILYNPGNASEFIYPTDKPWYWGYSIPFVGLAFTLWIIYCFRKGLNL